MKRKKGFLTLLMVGVVVLFLSLSESSLGGPGPNPPVPEGFKLIGPNLQGVIFAGWFLPPEAEYGIVEVFLRIDEHLYTGIISDTMPEQDFIDSTPSGVTQFTLPPQIAIDYNMGEEADPVIYDEKDVSNLKVIKDVLADIPIPTELRYKHLLYCDVKISFIIPK